MPRTKSREIPADLLDRNDVEASDDFRDAAHIEQVALR